MSKANGFVSFKCVPVRTGLSSIDVQFKLICPLIEFWVSLWLVVMECGELEHRGNYKIVQSEWTILLNLYYRSLLA